MGVDCWPVLRNTYMSLVSHGKPQRNGAATPVLSVLSAFNQLVKLYFSSGKTHSIVLTDYKYQARLNGVSYFKDASVIKELLTSSGDQCQILTQSVPRKKDGCKQSNSIFFLTALSVVISRMLMMLDFRKVIGVYLANFFDNEELGCTGSSKSVDMRRVEQNIYFVIVASFLFRVLLKKIKPKKCFIICYYSSLGMALCVACRRLGVETVDIQHGVSGLNMRAYGQWGGFPKRAINFNTLPQTFYCWAQSDVLAINSWADEGEYHQAVLTGSIWRQYTVEYPPEKILTEVQLEKEVRDYRKVVLFSARSTELPALIMQLMVEAPRDYFFILRLHPDVVDGDICVLDEKLRLMKAGFSLTKSTISSIYADLQLADIHITEWSAVVYDAYFEKLPSIVISDVGKDYFEALIESNDVSYCNEVSCIVSEVEGQPNRVKVGDSEGARTLEQLYQIFK